MKTTAKLLAIGFTAVAMFMGTNVNAQSKDASKWRLGIGLDGGAPTGAYNSFSKVDLGGTVRLQYGLDEGVAFTLTTGYYNFFAQTNSASIGGVTYTSRPVDQGLVPAKVGIKAYFTPGFYFGAEAGAGFETKYAKNAKLILSPGLGYSSKSWDAGIRYENFSGQSDNYGMVNLRIAYGFGL